MQAASAFYMDKGKNDLAAHFAAASQVFNIEDTKRDTLLKDRGGFSARLPQAPPADLRVGALQEQVQELQDDVEYQQRASQIQDEHR